MNCSYISVGELIELLKAFDEDRIVNVDWNGDFEIEENDEDGTINIIP